MFRKAPFFALFLSIVLLLVMTACAAFDFVTTGSDDVAAVDQRSAPLPTPQAEVMMDMAESDSEALAGAVAPQPAMIAATGMPPAEPEQESLAVDADDSSDDDMFFEDYGVNPLVETAEDNLSTFAMDVDTASYTLARSYLMDYNELPPSDAIRPEEFINYFPADYDSPQDAAFGIQMDAAPSPFGDEDQLLLRVGVQGKYIDPAERDPALLVFVVDVSGSMSGPERIGMVRDVLKILVGELRDDDRVSLVIYADQVQTVLQPTSATNREQIMAGIDSLVTGGSTYAEAGLSLGYQVAREHMRDGETTRVILLSDGVANVGETGPDAILKTVQQNVQAGVTLSTVGVGMGNYNDVLLEQLANDGNGNYHYVDNLREARRVFVHNLTATLQVIGFDAKIQVEFNPDLVESYRLIGYENRDVADEDFRNDSVDAGEVGAGHSITALYEITPVQDADSGPLATAYVRYEDADSREVVEINHTLNSDDVYSSLSDAPDGLIRAAGIAEFSELLRNSPFAETGSYSAVMQLLQPIAQEDDTDMSDVMQMLESAVRLSDQ